MYLPPLFAVAIDEIAFCTLVTLNGSGLIGSHLPMLLDPSVGEHGVLRGHLAKGNPQTADLAAGVDALAIFLGPDAYVSPAWYPSKREHGKVVPTWNYVAVHAYGRLEVKPDPAWLLGFVTSLTERHEAERVGKANAHSPAGHSSGQPPLKTQRDALSRAEPWQVSDTPPDHLQSMLKGIVGLELTITRLEGKWKLSQNQKPADADAVLSNLSASPDPGDRAVAEAMAALPLRH
jgi:transcriptional regulator